MFDGGGDPSIYNDPVNLYHLCPAQEGGYTGAEYSLLGRTQANGPFSSHSAETGVQAQCQRKGPWALALPSCTLAGCVVGGWGMVMVNLTCQLDGSGKSRDVWVCL